MREFFQDVSYMCSSQNTKSRGFYLGVTVVSVLILLLTVVAVVCGLIGVVPTENALKVYIASGFGIALVVALWVFLTKQ